MCAPEINLGDQQTYHDATSSVTTCLLSHERLPVGSGINQLVSCY